MSDLVRDVMTEDPLTVEPDESVEQARNLMVSCRIRHLPVASGELLRGIVSIRDLTNGAACVRDVMHAPVITVSPDDPIAVAAERLLSRHFSSLPVVSGELMVGIVTTTDLVRVVCERLGDMPITALMRSLAPDAPGGASVPVTARAVDAGHLLIRDRLDALSVLDGDRLVGSVSAFDFLRRL